MRTPTQVETLLEEAQSSATSSEISTQLLASVKEHAAQGRAARDEQEKQHGVEREFLLSIFRELEAQITLARTEREELLPRVDRERRSASKRHKARVRLHLAFTSPSPTTTPLAQEMEESLSRAVAERDAMRTRCDVEKEQLQKN